MRSFVFITVLLLSGTAHCSSFEDHVLTSFRQSVAAVEEVVIAGPMAEEITRWAIVRQLHENGLDRPATLCIPGISCGGWNRDMLETSLRRVPNDVELSRVHDSDGVPMYVLNGTNANVVSTVAIALLFDYYVGRFGWFSEREKEIWSESKVCSYLIAQGFDHDGSYGVIFAAFRGERNRILRKCSGGYGPGGERVSGEVKRLEAAFEYANERRQ